MVVIAASLYLPEHIAIVARRAYYYAAGDAESPSQRVSRTMTETAAKTAGAVVESISSLPTTAQEALKSATERVVGEL